MSKTISYTHYPAGVRVAREPDSRGFYRVRFTKNDGRPGEARRAALDDATKLAQELAGLITKRQAAEASRGEHTVAELAEEWLESGVGSATYQKSSRTYVRSYILPTLGDSPCHEWGVEATREVVADLEQRGYAESTISSVVRTMSSIARFGREHGFLEPQCEPTKKAYRHRKSYVDLAELPTADDVDKLAASAVEVLGESWRATQVYAAAYSGLRVGEMLGLRVRDIDLAAGSIRVQRQLCAAGGDLIPPKYDSKRSTIYPVWLDEHYQALVDGRDPDEPAFPARRGGHELYSTFYNQRWKPAALAAGWKPTGWTYHDLRHFFCTWALSKDGLELDVADVSRFVGHRTPDITWQVYVQSRPDRISRAREASVAGRR